MSTDIMEFDRRSLRSTSQTSLHSACMSQGRLNSNSHRFEGASTQRLPSRPVTRRNASLLRSPGPLESMLKTTTETGDIGLFTIKPAVPSATYHPPPRSRPGITDVNLLQASRSRLHEDRLYPDDRRLLPSSYRDTTSEIISLYGSDANFSRTCTPSNEDGRRSYSLTTCSSQPLPSQQSSGTVPSQASSTPMQRPRSPFPYPTRLKRPGTRPASPAMTENGTIDYSRMIEIDRGPPQRKMHHPHVAAHHMARRPPPLSLRSEANRSTSSLPCHAQPRVYHNGPMTYRALTPNSYYGGMPRSFDRPRRVSHAQSLRSTSVTSIVDMYHRPATATSFDVSLQNAASFYYDYSEGFQNENIPPVAPTPPLCPIPKRAASTSRPMILMAEDEGGFQDTLPSEKGVRHPDCVEDTSSTSRRETIPTVPAGVLEMHLEVNSPVDESDHEIPEPTNKAEAATTENAIAARTEKLNTRTVSSCWDQSVGFSSKNGSEIKSSADCLPQSMLDAANVTPQIVTSSSTGDCNCQDVQPLSGSLPSKESCDCLSPESEAPVASLEEAVMLPLPNNQLKITIESDASENAGPQFEIKEADGTWDKEEPLVVEGGDKRFLRRHRRNPAAARIRTSEINKPLNPTAPPPANVEDAIIISPEPISPARQLRVKQSIPQLMKALPPLPADAYEDSSETRSSSAIDSVEIDKLDLSGAASQQRSQPKNATADVRDQGSPPKFKVRLRQSQTSTSTSEVENPEANETETEAPAKKMSPTQRKLKIKVSRTHLDSSQSPDDGTIIRSPALKQCSSLANLEFCARNDIFRSQCPLEGAFSSPYPESVFESSSVRAASQETLGLGISCRTKKPKASAPSKAAGLAEVTNSGSKTNKKSFRRCQSLGSGISKDSRDKPRKRLSFLRLRSDKEQKGTPVDATIFPFGITGGSMVSSQTSTKKAKGNRKQCVSPSLTASKRSGRVRRWARGARKAIRLCVRKTVNLSKS